MKTKLHGLLTDLIEAYDLWNGGDYQVNGFEPVHDAVEAIRQHLQPVERADRDVWSELYAKNKVFDELAEDIGKKSWDEGHPPGNPFEGDDK